MKSWPDGLKAVKRMPLEKALKADNFHLYDYVSSYVEDLKHVVNLEASLQPV